MDFEWPTMYGGACSGARISQCACHQSTISVPVDGPSVATPWASLYFMDKMVIDTDGHILADVSDKTTKECKGVRVDPRIFKLSRTGGVVHAELVKYDDLSPSMNGQRIGMWRAQFLKTRSLFVHIPKAGGTSLELSLYGIDKQTQHSSIPVWNSHLPVGSKSKDLFKFAFVRHPLQRFLSGFTYIMSRDKCLEPQGESIQTVHFACILLRERFGNNPVRYLRYLSSLETWDDAPVHFRPQSSFVGVNQTEDNEQRQCEEHGLNFVGKMETMTDSWRSLFGLHDFGRPCWKPELAHTRKSAKHPNHAVLLHDKELNALVEVVYANDFDMFKYDKQ